MSIYLTIAFRVITIMLVLLIATLIISGRRTIGQMPVFDLLIIIVIGAITGADIAEPNIPHLHIIFAIIVTYLFQKLMNTIYLKSKIFRKLTTFSPIIILQDGQLSYKNIKSVRYSIDEVLMLLRQNDIFNLAEVKYGILEPNGELSLLLHAQYQKSTKGDVTDPSNKTMLYYTIILDGKIDKKNLMHVGLQEDDIIKLINIHGYDSPNEIFYASMDRDKNMTISPYNFICDDI